MNLGTASVIRANSRHLPLADNSVDLVVTSPPYFALRSYQDGGVHYAGQVGDEPTPAEFVDSLLEVTRECVRVLKPSGSLWVNLGDKYAGSNGQPGGASSSTLVGTTSHTRGMAATKRAPVTDARAKSLIGIPWRYAIRCIDDLGLILRAEVIWSKPNGLPESVTDRVRRSHETWFHFTLEPRYFSAVDEIREPHTDTSAHAASRRARTDNRLDLVGAGATSTANPLGKLPGSVWTIPTEPLRVPDHLGIDHFAAFPTAWPKRIIEGWSPRGVCVECGQGRRPMRDGAWHFGAPSHPVGQSALRKAIVAGVTPEIVASEYGLKKFAGGNHSDREANVHPNALRLASDYGISRLAAMTAISHTQRARGGYACACPEPTAPTTPAVVLDPFGDTGTTAMVAKALGRHGISVDMSADYCRLAEWRTNDRDQIAKVLGVAKAEHQPDDQGNLFDLLGEASA